MTTGQGMPTLFAYIMTEDKGSAPNPFHGFCTLALCMPMTRGAAQVGDYVVGLAGKRLRRGGGLALHLRHAGLGGDDL